MKETLKLGLILLVFALVAAGVLGYVNSVTEPIIAEREAREGRNPRTGETMTIAASKSPKFKAGKALKDSLN